MKGTDVTAAARTVVTLEHWLHHRVTAGDTIDRWTLAYGAKTLTTWPAEFEARAYARRMGWAVERMEEASL